MVEGRLTNLNEPKHKYMWLNDEENCNIPVSYSDPSVHSIIPVISKAYNKQKQQGFVLGDEGKTANLWVCGTELTTL